MCALMAYKIKLQCSNDRIMLVFAEVPDVSTSKRRTMKTVAIACQGGGSHCAFGAGALIELLGRVRTGGLIARAGEDLRVTGFSGTSGGAINALLAWYGVLVNDYRAGARSLDAFWHDMMATGIWDALGNAATVSAVRLQGVVPSIEIAPNAWSAAAQESLGAQIAKRVPFAELPDLVGDDSPELHIGAADILSGRFAVFGASGPRSVPSLDQILASAAVPEIFPPVNVGGRYYWDGLLSQNPPIRDFLRGRDKARIPDEIWIIRINPVARVDVPTQLNDIRDRRNEMAGNLAIDEETYFIGQVNQWVARGQLPGKKHVEMREIVLSAGLAKDRLDYASKLDRDPAFIAGLLDRGRVAAAAFLDER
jgi:NTE family protein